MMELCQALGMASEQLCAPQVELIPIEHFLLCCDSVLASLYFCTTDVHQRIVPKSWGIALNVCYTNALTCDFLWSEKQLDRLMYKESKAEPWRSRLHRQDIKPALDTALTKTLTTLCEH